MGPAGRCSLVFVCYGYVPSHVISRCSFQDPSSICRREITCVTLSLCVCLALTQLLNPVSVSCQLSVVSKRVKDSSAFPRNIPQIKTNKMAKDPVARYCDGVYIGGRGVTFYFAFYTMITRAHETKPKPKISLPHMHRIDQRCGYQYIRQHRQDI